MWRTFVILLKNHIVISIYKFTYMSTEKRDGLMFWFVPIIETIIVAINNFGVYFMVCSDFFCLFDG